MSDGTLRSKVSYFDGETPVLLGDRVQLRIFLRRRTGQVTYVPGISAVSDEMEHGGLTWVGIQVDNGPTVGKLVDPSSFALQKGICFLGRADLATSPILPGQLVFEDEQPEQP